MNATALILRCRQADRPALDEFARRFAPEIERLALAVLDVGPRQQALPTVQLVTRQTLLAALTAGELYRDETELKLWLMGTAVKLCQPYLRTRMRAASSQADAAQNAAPDAAQNGMLAALDGANPRRATQEALRRLEDNLRIPLVLHYATGLSLTETAQVLKLNARTLAARLARGRELLRVRLEAQ